MDRGGQLGVDEFIAHLQTRLGQGGVPPNPYETFSEAGFDSLQVLEILVTMEELLGSRAAQITRPLRCLIDVYDLYIIGEH